MTNQIQNSSGNVVTLPSGMKATVTTSSDSTLMQASEQWRSRPADERFTSLTELHAHTTAIKNSSYARVVSSRKIEAQPLSHTGLQIVGPNGIPVMPTHWSFGQLAARAGAPAGYLRSLAAPLAADCINFGLKVNRSIEDLGVLLHKDGGKAELTAVTGPNYGRIWNAEITGALVDRFGDGLTGQFTVPGEFGKKVDITKDNTTLFASDRNMFVFLADEQNRITIPNRRNGAPGSLARGFFMWNSEVGDCTFGIGMFLFDYACCNRIVWGAEGYTEMKIRHTTSAPDKWLEEVLPAIKSYSESSAAPIEAMLRSAQQKKIEKVEDFLLNRFSRPQYTAIVAAHAADEARPIETLWDASTAITAYARGIDNTDTRIELEREAGRILDMAA